MHLDAAVSCIDRKTTALLRVHYFASQQTFWEDRHMPVSFHRQGGTDHGDQGQTISSANLKRFHFRIRIFRPILKSLFFAGISVLSTCGTCKSIRNALVLWYCGRSATFFPGRPVPARRSYVRESRRNEFLLQPVGRCKRLIRNSISKLLKTIGFPNAIKRIRAMPGGWRSGEVSAKSGIQHMMRIS